MLKDQWRGIPVEYWTYPDTVNAAWRTFGETPAMIDLYSQLLGVSYPWDKYDQSIIPDFTYGGMENVSATTQTDLALHPAGGEPEASGRGLVAHELAHQWFGDLTTTADWADIWLNEGITTYMESVHNEKTRGWDAGQLSWWGQQQQAMQADQNEVRALVWLHKQPEAFGKNRAAVKFIDGLAAGAAVLDNRTLNFGTHHQKILVVNGDDCSGSAGCNLLGTTEMFDPVAKTFSPSATLCSFGDTATAVTRGGVLVTGARSRCQAPRSCTIWGVA